MVSAIEQQNDIFPIIMSTGHFLLSGVILQTRRARVPSGYIKPILLAAQRDDHLCYLSQANWGLSLSCVF
jgi:hypothetical protein